MAEQPDHRDLHMIDPPACDRAHASVAGHGVHRGYDQRNRLTTLTVPDGRGNFHRRHCRRRQAPLAS